MLDTLAQAELATIDRFYKKQKRTAETQGHGATERSLGVSKALVGDLSKIIQERLSEITQSLSAKDPLWHLKSFSYVVRNLDPHVLALSTLTALLHCVSLGADFTVTTRKIGAAVQGECWAAKLLASNAKLYKRIETAAKRDHGNLRYRKQAARSIAKRAGFGAPEWTNKDQTHAGTFLLDCVMKAFPNVFVVDVVPKGKNNTVLIPRITQEGLELGEAAVEAAIRANPVFIPCLEAPKPWTRFRDGGYWDERTRLSAPLVRAYYKETTAAIKAAMKNGTMQQHVDAVNALQAVPWKINTRVFEVVQWAYENNIAVAGIPSQVSVAEPARLSDEEWNDEDKRRLQRSRIGKVKEHNRGLLSNRVLFAQDMATASRLATAPAFYTPFNSDWRGRVYAVPHFNFQRDDRVRALFQFANGMPIGVEGLKWLKVHVANCGDFGKISKRPFEERIAWVDAHVDIIRDIAKNPYSTARLRTLRPGGFMWTDADKPFLFLAACIELTHAIEQGAGYVTRLPVSFDGSCSGLQHLSAMTRAPEGALVNLTNGELPQDVYQTVADLVETRIRADAALPASSEGSPHLSAMAQTCLDYIWDPKDPVRPRKTVKRNVMTYSYSSREYGMRQQLADDLMKPLELKVLEGKFKKHPFGDDNGRAAAQYLSRHIYAAIEEVVTLPAQAMAFLQSCARALAHEGRPLNWTTPAGLPWSNRYHTATTKQVDLWLSDVRITVKVAEDEHSKTIDKDKAANGVSPNFVHALDAAHLLLTTNACGSAGITNIATVHDSFGCLAPQAVRFNQIIRETFVKMYEEHDVLAEILEAAKRDLTVHNWGRLPELPARGSLDLKEVLNAKFAFA